MLLQIGQMVDWLLIEVNYLIKQKGDAYDYKREFKSPRAVEQIRDEVLKSFEKDKFTGRAKPFAFQ